MAQTSNSIEMLKKRLIAEISHDKKKAVILGVLLLVALLFVGKLLLESSPSRATAAANPAAMVAAAAPAPPAAENPAAAMLGAMIPEADRPKSVAGRVTRDIFMPDASIFPRVAANTDASGKVNVVEDNQSRRDVELKRRIALVRKQGAELHLEGTNTGRVPIAIINGTVLGLDGVINGFRIVRIDSQACVVEKEGIKLNLKMK